MGVHNNPGNFGTPLFQGRSLHMDGRSREAYVCKAQEAERIAGETRDEVSRQSWLALAKGWRDLAEQLRRASELKS
jgi:hypothetical protein